MLTLLPAASLTACLAWSSRKLYPKLRRAGRTGVRWVYGSTRGPPTRQEDAAHEGSVAWMRMQKACRKQGGRRAHQLTQVGTCKEGRECSQMCQRALTGKQTLPGGGALELGDLRLVEDGSQRSGALGSNAVALETASEGQDGMR